MDSLYMKPNDIVFIGDIDKSTEVMQFGVGDFFQTPLYSSLAYNLVKRAYLSNEVPLSYPTKAWVNNVVLNEFRAVTIVSNYAASMPSLRQIAACVGRLTKEAYSGWGGKLLFKKREEPPNGWGCFPEFEATEDEVAIVRGVLKGQSLASLSAEFGRSIVEKTVGMPLDPIKAAYAKKLNDSISEVHEQFKREVDTIYLGFKSINDMAAISESHKRCEKKYAAIVGPVRDELRKMMEI